MWRAQRPRGGHIIAVRSDNPQIWVAEEIQALGGKCITWEADLSDPDMISKLFDQAEKRWGSG